MLEYFLVILRHKRTVIAATVIGAVAAAGVSLVLPKRFVSTAAFIPGGVEQEITGSGSFLQRLGMVGEAYATFVRLRRNFVIDYVIRSRTMARMMDERFGLREEYGAGSGEELRDELNERVRVNIRDEGVIELAVEAGDPALAREMAASLIELTDSIFMDLTASNAEAQVAWLEDELERRERRMARMDSAMTRFMAVHGIFEVEAQAAAAFDVIGGLSARLSALEIERRIIERTAEPGAAQLQRIDLEIEKFEEELLSVVETEGGRGLFPPLSEFPGIVTEYLGMVAERMAQEFAAAYVTLRLEDARISAGSRQSVMRVIDPPAAPDRRAWPKRKQIVLITTMAVFFWTCFVLLLRERGPWGGDPLAEDANG